MLIFLAERLAYLATPKTGSTAVEMTLRPRADIVFARGRKHVTAQRYQARVRPFLKETFSVSPDSVAVMREPVDQLRSWYRYRMREAKDGAPQSTRGLSFDEFISAVISDDPPEFARVGSQFAFLTNGKGRLVADHVFAWEDQPQFLAFMSTRLDGPVTPEQRNVSPDIPAPLDQATEAKLRRARAAEFVLYQQLIDAGGLLRRGKDRPAL